MTRIFVPREIVEVTQSFNAHGVDIGACLDVLRQLDQMGYRQPILHGGYLRDKFLGVATRDFDAFTRSKVEPDNSPQMPGRERRVFPLGDLEIDIMFQPGYKTGKDAAQHSVVPLCSPAMDMSGRIFANRQFLEAAENRLYAPDVIPNEYQLRRMLAYFERLRQKIPDLRLRMPQISEKVIAKLKDPSLLDKLSLSQG